MTTRRLVITWGAPAEDYLFPEEVDSLGGSAFHGALASVARDVAHGVTHGTTPELHWTLEVVP